MFFIMLRMFIDFWFNLTSYPFTSSPSFPNQYSAYEWLDENDHDEGYAFVMGVIHGPQPPAHLVHCG